MLGGMIRQLCNAHHVTRSFTRAFTRSQAKFSEHATSDRQTHGCDAAASEHTMTWLVHRGLA